jgi:hypothetical protein
LWRRDWEEQGATKEKEKTDPIATVADLAARKGIL